MIIVFGLFLEKRTFQYIVTETSHHGAWITDNSTVFQQHHQVNTEEKTKNFA